MKKDIRSILNELKRFMKVEINKKGFNRIFFKLNIHLFDNIPLITKMVDKTFQKFRKNKHFFLLCKVYLADGRILTLHKGIVVLKSDKDNYLDFLLKNLNEKEDFYQLLLCKSIFFEFKFIKKSSLKNYITIWPEIEAYSQTLIQEEIPKLNDDFRNWGIITMDRPDFKIIIGRDHKFSYIVFPKHAEVFYKGKFLNKIEKDFF